MWFCLLKNLMCCPHRPHLTHNSVGGTYLHTLICTSSQYLHTPRYCRWNRHEIRNCITLQLWEGPLHMFHTVGLVWLCHKVRLFSWGRRHSNQTSPPRNSRSQTFKRKSNAKPVMILSNTDGGCLIHTERGDCWNPSSMQTPTSWCLTELTHN